MRKATIKITGISDYCQSRYHATEKLNKESADAYEKRTYAAKAHWNRNGNIVIPGLAFKKCVSECAKYLSLPIPGKGKSTYTKHFQSGVLVFSNPVICDPSGNPIHKDDLDKTPYYRSETLFVPSSGVAGDGKRVHRMFPVVSPGWNTTVDFVISDDTVTRDVFEEVLSSAGIFIGVGAFRVRNQGIWGTFQHEVVDWQDQVPLAALAG